MVDFQLLSSVKNSLEYSLDIIERRVSKIENREVTRIKEFQELKDEIKSLNKKFEKFKKQKTGGRLIMNISGNTIIFKNEYGFSTTISNKNQEGQYENMRVSVQLPKGVELENKTKINVTKGFISFYKTKEGLPKPKFVIQEFESEYKEQPEDITDDIMSDQFNLPF